MPTIPANEPKETKKASITFLCDENWKRLLVSKLALRGETMQHAAITALSKYAGVEIPKVNAA